MAVDLDQVKDCIAEIAEILEKVSLISYKNENLGKGVEGGS